MAVVSPMPRFKSGDADWSLDGSQTQQTSLEPPFHKMTDPFVLQRSVESAGSKKVGK